MSESTLNQRKSNWLPFTVEVEPRLTPPPAWFSWALTIGLIIFALLIGALVIAFAGGNPWAAYSHIARASFGSIGVLSDTLVKAIPLMIVGLACTIAFRMRIWNIGAEGQFFLGAFGASAVVLTPILPSDSPQWLFILTMLIFGMAAGAIWGFIPGYLKAKFNVNEVISTLMLNYIAVSWNNYWIYAVWTEGGFQMSRMFPRNAWLPRLTDFADRVPAFGGLTVHFGLVLAILAAIVVWLILYRSQWGYEIRVVGDNPPTARYAGIPIARNTVLVMMLSGALAGLAGMSEISGVVHRLQGAISPGYGYTGIIVAWLAKLNPFAVIPVAIFFGALILAGREIQPSGIPKMIQGIILVCLIASDFLMRNKIRIRRKGEA
ncbi:MULTISPECIES: ABC transporter permease [Anaerolinea]|uniref:ABC transporter permease n=1 Tax=Anaerolinea TaxID=233189 RepID=UPI0026282062|nr:ABC transporter permease [Anaerolinea thermophila]